MFWNFSNIIKNIIQNVKLLKQLILTYLFDNVLNTSVYFTQYSSCVYFFDDCYKNSHNKYDQIGFRNMNVL